MAVTLTIRNISDEDAELLTVQARNAGYPSREAWLKHELERLAHTPLAPPAYRLRVYGPEGAFASIRRLDTGALEISAGGLNESQAVACREAQLLIIQNGPGDREKAIRILQADFEVVLPSF